MQDYLPLIAEEPALAAVEGNARGSRPKELFLDELEAAEAAYGKERAALAAALKEITVAADASIEAFQEQVAAALAALRAAGEGAGQAAADAAAAVAPGSLRAYFEELLGEATEAQERAAREARRAQDDFLRLLRHAKGLTPESTYEAAEAACGAAAEWGAVPGGDEARRALYGERASRAAAREAERAMRKRSASPGGSGSAEGSDGGRRDRSRRGKHHKRHKKEHRRSRSRGGRGGRRQEEGGEVEEGEVC